jgi:glutamine synthetase
LDRCQRANSSNGSILSSQPELIVSHCERLKKDFGLYPITASEIEFYIKGSEGCGTIAAFWDEVKAECTAAKITLAKIEKEKGREQHEISLQFSTDASKTATDTEALKTIIGNKASAHSMEASFAAKPFNDQPGSGFHVHLHLTTVEGKNVFYKDDYDMSDALKFSIGGLLAGMLPSMPIFAPSKESYARFKPGSNAPMTVSWGANNRTTAIRLPDAAHDNKRIEHRVAGADADAVAVMGSILGWVCEGLAKRIDPGPQIFGDAALPMYKLPPLVPVEAGS